MLRKITIPAGLILLLMPVCPGQGAETYKSLDKDDPIIFGGNYISYKNQHILLGPKAFFVDGQFTAEEADQYPYVFNSINEAAKHLTNGTEESPMVLYIAPYVYWIDDPDDPEIRLPDSSGTPYGLIIECEWLRFFGLTENAGNVVLACNRGQTMGSRGNFTLFKFIGQGTGSENLTFGNYCNVDLDFPLKPALSRKKRAPAIVQAQLIHCNGDKIVARNTRFISRLNLCPFVGGKRVLFDHCHFESTDDALCATGVYLNCTFDFYGSKPFYWTRGTGSVFLDSDIRSFIRGKQYFTKAGGQLALIDTRINSETLTYLGWRDFPPPETRNYQYNVTLNGTPVTISRSDPPATIDLTDKAALNAYRIVNNGKVIYNTYNLLCGDDDWDPMGVKNLVLEAGMENSERYTLLPVQLLIAPSGITLETGRDSVRLIASVNRFGNFPVEGQKIKWAVDPESESSIKLRVSGDGLSCEVLPDNSTDEARQVIVNASTPSGLEAASVIIITPSKLDPPEFVSLPRLTMRSGKISVHYELAMRFEDQSLVTWSRCKDADGSNPIEVAVSRDNHPLLDYELTTGDSGYHIMASVAPKHQRCDPGEAVTVITKKPVSNKDIETDPKILETDFRNMSTRDQPEVIPGFWTLYSFEPEIIGRKGTANKKIDAWYYGEGSSGSAGYRGLLQSQYARMYYTPDGRQFGDMKLSMTVVPFKNEGQGFSIAPLYMDVLIKFDAKTLTGYGLRFIRTTKYHDAVDCYFVKYEHGNVTAISKPVSTSCYRPECAISIEVRGKTITAHAETQAEYYEVPGRPEVVKVVDMETAIDPNSLGGFGIEYAGGATSLIKEMRVEWK